MRTFLSQFDKIRETAREKRVRARHASASKRAPNGELPRLFDSRASVRPSVGSCFAAPEVASKGRTRFKKKGSLYVSRSTESAQVTVLCTDASDPKHTRRLLPATRRRGHNELTGGAPHTQRGETHCSSLISKHFKRSRFPTDVSAALEALVADTKEFEDFVLNLAISYGARGELVNARLEPRQTAKPRHTHTAKSRDRDTDSSLSRWQSPLSSSWKGCRKKGERETSTRMP